MHSEASTPAPLAPHGHRRLWVAIGVSCLAFAAVQWVRPLSVCLRVFAPDGDFDAGTRQFMDAQRYLLVLFGVVSLAIGWRTDLRGTVARLLTQPPSRSGSNSSRPILILAALTFGLRLIMASFSDIGFGDDGARVFWLEQWLRHPVPPGCTLWAPGQLYLQALLYLVTRDALRAGVLLSALASAGTVGILARSVQRNWGLTAALCAGTAVALLPVSLAHGATPDVNPLFAFLIVAGIASVQRYLATSRLAWLVLAWLCMAFAAWSRFEAFALVPALALLLWSRLPGSGWARFARAGGFTLLCWVPSLLWNVLARCRTGPSVLETVRSDPSLAGPALSHLFSYVGGVWQGVTLPFLVFGLLGMIRAVQVGRGREWIAVALLHGVTLAGASALTGNGTQARYMILLGSIFAAYSGVFLGGLLQASRLYGVAGIGIALALLVWTPGFYPDSRDLWLRRSPRLRTVVDHLAEASVGQHVVWVADESEYFFPCRVRRPLALYHPWTRADYKPSQLLQSLDPADRAIACVRETAPARTHWAAFLQAASGVWAAEPLGASADYRLYRLQRVRAGAAPATGSESGYGAGERPVGPPLASGARA